MSVEELSEYALEMLKNAHRSQHPSKDVSCC